MSHFAIKNPDGNILSFTISSNERSAMVKIEDTKKSKWFFLYKDGYRCIPVRIIELKSQP